ncbi:MAG: type II toxin-antitoxin system YafQ family toxin [Candidatus Melainabacteria bacterium]|nr:type II toxin-antitoxin system mRNA interferase toxin, RelE/StbE family [Nitrospira sp. WS110]
MRTIERASAFKRDYKRVKATPRHNKDVDALLSVVLEKLVTDQALPHRNRDHELSGNWNGYRECHLKPDLLLIYRKLDEDTLRLARLGSHSELFE